MHLNGVGMGLQSLGARHGLHVARQAAVSGGVDTLHADLLHKVVRGEATAAVRPASGRQNVIAAAGVITKGLRAKVSDKNSARRTNFLEQRR